MSVIHKSGISDFTRGGQSTLHFLRMIGQVITQFGGFLLFCFVVFYVGYYFAQTTSYERYVGYKWVYATGVMEGFNETTYVTDFETPEGKTITVRGSTLRSDKFVNSLVDKNKMVLIEGFFIGLLLVIGVFIFVIFYILRTGNSLRKESFLRGNEIVKASDLAMSLRFKRVASDLRIAGVPIVKGSETSGILVTGSPGSGKSVAIKELLSQIRKRGDRAIVYSTAGEFIEGFYDEKKDVILNPLDARCPSWHLWSEARLPSDYDMIAASLIPISDAEKDSFWNLAARTLFSAVAMRLGRRGTHSTSRLLSDLLTIKMSDAAQLVEGTEAAALLAEGAEKTALSVRATLAAYIRSLKFLSSGGDVFSIRKWVEDDEGSGCIFISSRSDQKDSLRPLVTMWLDIAVRSILSLPADRERRIWVIVDELPSLNRVSSLKDLQAEGRKYGACCLLGFQSFSQLSEIYGPRGAETISGLCDTWLCYRANEPATAEWVAKSFGTGEYMETSEGISYGANEIRDGVSLSMQRKLRNLVIPSEVMNLPNLAGFLRLQGEFPIAKINIKYRPYPVIAPAYIQGELSSSVWNFADGDEEHVDPDTGEITIRSKSKVYDDYDDDIPDEGLEERLYRRT